MKTSIEREIKFLIPDINIVPLDEGKCESVLIEQGYLINERDKSLRVRITAASDADLTLKVGTDPSHRTEYEQEIDLEYANLLLREVCPKVGYTIEKYRYFVKDEFKKCWFIDEYHDRFSGLVIAEYEFGEYEHVILPEWLDDCKDVTHDSRYLNCSLSLAGNIPK